jgi:predicted ArsR family transcriptional regulator
MDSYRTSRHYLSCKIIKLRALANKLEDRMNGEMLLGGMTRQRFLVLWELLLSQGASADKVAKKLRSQHFGLMTRTQVRKQMDELERLGCIKLVGKLKEAHGNSLEWKVTEEGRRIFRICYEIWESMS